MSTDIIAHLGPLAPLAGVWIGDKGDDTAPSDDRGTETNRFHERMRFEPIRRVENHEQILYGLRYATMAWRLGEDDPFHEEVGYWLWDPRAEQVMRCFMVPRGVAVIAGGHVAPGDRSFALRADLSSPTYGVLSSPFLYEEFKTVRYELSVTLVDEKTLHYREDTVLDIKGQAELFHHVDENTLTRQPD